MASTVNKNLLSHLTIQPPDTDPSLVWVH